MWYWYALGIILFIIALIATVLLHEAGHMVTAKKLGLPVSRFFFGFGPKLFSFQSKNTEYGMKAVPLGGFVDIKPSQHDEDHARAGRTDNEIDFEHAMLSNVPAWKRIAVFLAGPLVNIILGTLIFVMLFWVTPVKEPLLSVHSADSCSTHQACGAQQSGIRQGDVIQKVNGHTVHNTAEVGEYIHGSTTASVTVQRDGNVHTLSSVPITNNTLGVHFNYKEYARSLPESVQQTGSLFGAHVKALSHIPSKVKATAAILVGHERTDDALGSVVSTGKAYGDTTASSLPVQSKVTQLMAYAGAFNLSIGLINLIPIVPLDGGRILVAIGDGIKGRINRLRRIAYAPVRQSFVTAFTMGGVLLVLGVMGIVIAADIVSPASLS